AVAVSTRAGHDPDGMLPRPAHRALHVLTGLAEDDGARLNPVEARGVEEPRLVVPGGAANDHFTAESVAELVEDPCRPSGGSELGEASCEGQPADDEGGTAAPREHLERRDALHAAECSGRVLRAVDAHRDRRDIDACARLAQAHL